MRRSPRHPQQVSEKALTYYQTHFREAIRDEEIICLECGRLFKALTVHHLWKHGLTLPTYKERWGYNRTTALISHELQASRRQHAMARDLPSLAPPGSLEKGWARPRTQSPRRPQARLTISERTREEIQQRKAKGWQPLKRRKRVADADLLRLVRAGLSNTDLLAQSGLKQNQLRRRLRDLGIRIPVPRHPESSRYNLLNQRPNAARRVTNAQLFQWIQEGLNGPAIARLAGVTRGAVWRRLRTLRQRSPCPPQEPEPASGG